jgi:hypothetical protein
MNMVNRSSEIKNPKTPVARTISEMKNSRDRSSISQEAKIPAKTTSPSTERRQALAGHLPTGKGNSIMAGKGAPPSGNTPRGKKEIKRETVKSDGKLGGWPLPKGALGQVREPVVDEVTGVESFPDVEWHPMTIKWWDAWRRSPQSVKMITEVDWHYLLETALMHHQMWVTKRFELAAEIRMRVSKFGATPEDRARLRMDIDIPQANSVGNATGTATNVVDIQQSRRAKMIQQETDRKAADDAAKIARLEAEASS